MIVPLGAGATMLVTAAIVAAVLFRRTSMTAPVVLAYCGVLLALVIARTVIGTTHVGWLARYYANDRWAGTPERSADFPRLDGTRVDRVVSFRDDTFPAYYLNDPAFARGVDRHTSEPMSVEWEGFTYVDVARREPLSLVARGRADVQIDGEPVLTTDGAAQPSEAHTSVAVAAGDHQLTIRYAKPAGVGGIVHFQTALVVSPDQSGSRSARTLEAVTRLIAASIIGVAAAFALHAAWLARPLAASTRVAIGLFAAFGAQGWWQASRFIDHAVTLNALDDWFAYESRARDVVANGPLMTLGAAIGSGAPFFFHPFYSYWLALVHLVTGESLFGPIFLQFVILAVVAVVMWRLSSDLFGERAATIGVAALVVIFELDFARYYTVTLLTENVYILTVSMMLVSFVRWIRHGATRDLVKTAVWCGVSTITRLPMMFYLAPALVLIAIVSARRTRSAAALVASTALAFAVWAATIAPITLRNWFVARRFVLIADVPARVLDLLQNFPAAVPPDHYIGHFQGTMSSGLRVLAEATRDHPAAMMLFHARKLGFSLGMIQWFGGYRAHPELVAVSVLYIAMCCVYKPMRSICLWPIHLFVVTHLASMVVTIPWNYGYRLILPPFVYTTTLSVAAFVSLIGSRMKTPMAGSLPHANAL